MELSPDMDGEDIQLFLDETEELLQVLGETFVQLETSGGAPEVLQEIFRVAHTLKGSAGMLGYREMTELSHAMETLLDGVRQGSVAVSEQLVDALLHSLDGLTALRDTLAARGEVTVDIAALVAELEKVTDGEPGDTAIAESGESDSAELDVDQTVVAEAVEAVGDGARDYRLTVSIKPDSPWLSVRAFQLLTAAGEVGSVLTSVPTIEEIEAGMGLAQVELVLVSTKTREELVAALSSIEDVTDVNVSQWFFDGDDGEPEHEEPQAQPEVRESLEHIGQGGATAGGPGSARKQAAAAPGSVRIDVDRLDDLINALGELVVDYTRVHQLTNALSQRYRGDDLVESLVETTAKIDKNMDSLQEGTMAVRMQPIGTMFNGLPANGTGPSPEDGEAHRPERVGTRHGDRPNGDRKGPGPAASPAQELCRSRRGNAGGEGESREV